MLGTVELRQIIDRDALMRDFNRLVSERAPAAEPHSGVTTMPKESLREAITHLQGELTSGEPLSPDERARLERVLGEVAGVLDEDDDDSRPETSTVDELRDGLQPNSGKRIHHEGTKKNEREDQRRERKERKDARRRGR